MIPDPDVSRDGIISNCSGNFKHGPVFGNYATWHRDGVATITVLHDEPVDGGNPDGTQEDSFPGVTGTKLRLQVVSSSREPSIYEFEVYNDAQTIRGTSAF